MMESRKQKERELHNLLRSNDLKKDDEKFRYLTSNKKFYSINRKSLNFFRDWLLRESRGKKVLDYCCGNGEQAIFLAKNGIEVVGIDISDTSIENCRQIARQEKVDNKATFLVMDAEKTEFPDNHFDTILCAGVLHHLDTSKAFPELSRITKPGGKVICDEPLVYNPIFHLYRKMTPHLRTAWEMEHILSKKDLDVAKESFAGVETNFFHLFSVAAVPFRNTAVFEPVLGLLEKADDLALKLPLVKWLAWQIVFVLSSPKKYETT